MEVRGSPTFTVAEAAERLGCSPLAVREMVDRGLIRALRFAGAVRITREEVERSERSTERHRVVGPRRPPRTTSA